MESELLFYFPEHATSVGVAPAFYDVITPAMVADAVEAGGRDVSDDPGSWVAFNRQLAEYDAALA